MDDLNISREHILKKIQAYIARMPSLSTTVVKVLDTCNDPMASANDLKRVVSLDPVLTARVLKLINSAYYSLGKPVASLSRAIIMLGVNTVKNLALSSTIIENLNSRNSRPTFSADDFWGHSLAVGVVAKLLAGFTGVPATGREEYFVAGLLHDIGKLPLHRKFPDDYHRICESVKEGRDELYRNEVKCLGIDHGTVGKIISNKWHLGLTLLESLSYHHNPKDGAAHCRKFVSIIALANQLVLQLNIGNAGDHFVDQAKLETLMADTDVDWTMLGDLQGSVSGEIERAKLFLEVVQDG
jgi:HD-like signal output (HDOD) protein